MTYLQMPTPDASVLGRSQQIIKDLTALAGAEAVIADEEGRRTFETDGLTAYRCMPLAVVLPTTTEEVSRILKYCHREGIKVVARGAGTSLWRSASGGRRGCCRCIADEPGSGD